MSVSSRIPLLKRIAERVAGPGFANAIWKRIEIIGDVAIIRKSFEVSTELYKVIGEEILREIPYVKSVWLATSPVQGFERVREYIHLAGERKSETMYREHGCVFKIDFTKVYISPVLGFDHIRIAKKVKDGEKILNMFAGFGPYSIIVSKHAKPTYVISIDLNEFAVHYARINIEINKVGVFNEIIHGDALTITPSLNEKFDRILMPYPDAFKDAFKVALNAVKIDGYLHPHLFVEASNKREALHRAYDTVSVYAQSLGAIVESLGGHVIRGVAPRKYHVTVDVVVKSKPKNAL
ncbi:MAG: class I SAM-dependent methyltransferase family protein [Ignisphaera sp.]